MEFQTINLDTIDPNPNQPRKDWGDDSLQELAESIKQVGVLVPLLVRPLNGRYEIVHGERRWRAAKMASLDQVPAMVQALTDTEAFLISLTENLQRQNLNPIEEAKAYEWLQDQGYSQAKIGEVIGKSQQYVASRLVLLALPPGVKEKITTRVVSPSHGEVLASLKSGTLATKLADNIASDKMTVRQLEYALRRQPWLDSKVKSFDDIEEKPLEKIDISDRGLVHTRGEKKWDFDLKFANREATAKANGEYIDEWGYSGMIPKAEANDYPILTQDELEAAFNFPEFITTYQIYWGDSLGRIYQPSPGDMGEEYGINYWGCRSVSYTLPCGKWGWGDFPIEEMAGSESVKMIRRKVFIPYIIPSGDYAKLLAVLSGKFVYAGFLYSYQFFSWVKPSERLPVLGCLRNTLDLDDLISTEELIAAMKTDIDKAKHITLEAAIDVIQSYREWTLGLKERPDVFEYLRQKAIAMTKKRWRSIMRELDGEPYMARIIAYKDGKRFVLPKQRCAND